MDKEFTTKLQTWLSLPREERDWDEGALMLLQLSGNRIMYRNISVNPVGKAEFIEGKLSQYLEFRLAQLTHEQVMEMQKQVAEIAKAHEEFKAEDNEAKSFKVGIRVDHERLPDDIKALYVENLDLVHRMRELHLRLRTMSTVNSNCADSDRYPFLKEIIRLDKKLHDNWNTYDHYVISAEDAEKVDAPKENKGGDDTTAAPSQEVPSQAQTKPKSKKTTKSSEA